MHHTFFQLIEILDKYVEFKKKLEKVSSEKINQMSQFTYWMPHCKNEKNWGKSGCPEKDPDSLDLSVLTINMWCFREATLDKEQG